MTAILLGPSCLKTHGSRYMRFILQCCIALFQDLEARLESQKPLQQAFKQLKDSTTPIPTQSAKMITSITASGYDSDSNVTRAVFNGIYKKVNKMYNLEVDNYKKNMQAL